MLWFHAFPSYLQIMLQEAKAKKTSPAMVLSYYGLTPQITMYQHQADKILQSCEAVKEIGDKALALKTKLEQLEKQSEAYWREFIDSTES
jgi:hypothetical protein